MRIGVIGAGVFGATAALELRERGHEVTLLDPGPVPHIDAASTDISKLIRMDYGADAFYTELMECALEGWRRWNASWHRPLFHSDGMRVLCHEMVPGSFEADSAALLSSRGHVLEPLGGGGRWTGFAEGYFNPQAGWAESGEVVQAVLAEGVRKGVESRAEPVQELIDGGVRTPTALIRFDQVVVAVGTWLPVLLPELADRVRSVGQPVLHFRPDAPETWRAPVHPPWAADIANTGWYGFPANADGVVKVANHGPGVVVDPRAPRRVAGFWEQRFRDFFTKHLPGLAEAPLVGARLCLYADSFDGDFWVCRHPERPGVVISGGGSGHGFKFAPLLGALAADVVEGIPNPWNARFAWRELGPSHTEAARFSPNPTSTEMH